MRSRLAPRILAVVVALAPVSSWAATKPAVAPATKPWTTLREPSGTTAQAPDRAIRTNGDRFEIATPNGERSIFFHGVNLGAGTPGHFPGEFAMTPEDYRRWLRFLHRIHANSIRVYTLHPPSFYRALAEENASHPDDPIWLFQEVWTELPDSNDFWDPAFTRTFENEIRLTIDAVHGNAQVIERPGHAAGRYDADVSPWIAGWLLGREWEPYAVRETQRLHPDSTAYHGRFFAVDGGTPMEVWLGRICDTAAAYESKRYGLARPVAFVNWPTLDPMKHPTETERGGAEAEHDEDAYSVDPVRIRPVQPIGLASGFLGYFANYHAYPYYPDFIDLDPGYAAYRDRHGPCNYGGYLMDLKAHTRGIPLVIGEYGVPTSRGIAHQQPQGIHHGGDSEWEQGERDVRLLEDIVSAGCAGSLLFSLYDEWFKVNWLVERNERPRDRDPLWLNRQDAEENYGLLGFDPPPPIRIDGATGDWAGIRPYAAATDSTGATNPIRSLYVTSDETSLYLRLDLARPSPAKPAPHGKYPRARSSTPPPAKVPLRAMGVSIDVLDAARGDHVLPAPLQARWSHGAEFVLVIEPPGPSGAAPFGAGSSGGRAELFVDRAMNYSAFARILGDRGQIERDRAPFRPVANEDGRYLPLLLETNRERVSRSGKVYPALYLDSGRLSLFRQTLTRSTADTGYVYDPHADWAISKDGRSFEFAIPWGLLNVGDPSSLAVLDDKDGTPVHETTRTDGIALLAWATTASGFEADSLGPTAPGFQAAPKGSTWFLGPPGTSQSIDDTTIMVTTPTAALYSWKGWEQPITQERVKRSAAAIQKAFGQLEIGDDHGHPDGDSSR
jgi:hypothetical protein